MLFSACLCSCSKSNNVAAQIQSQAVIDNALIINYLNSKGLPVNNIDTISLTTGLKGHSGVCYIIDTPGTGTNIITSSTQITVGYTGMLLTTGNGTKIFTQTNNFHPSFILGSVIRGWQLGIPFIKKGGTITLYIPSKYAYGPYPQAGIGLPANAVLIFDITLYNITN